jgi:uncharacterized protein YcbX
MATGQLITVGRVRALWRYPVKSTLGEEVGPVDVDDAGLHGDRGFGIIDTGTALVASAKRPHRWRGLLQLRSEFAGPGLVRIHFPDGRSALSTDDGVDKFLSEFLGEDVELRSVAPPAATLERAVPEDVLTEGVAADVGFTTLEIAAGAPPGTFFDFSPMQFVTTAALAAVAAAHPAGHVDVVRYRPNIVIETDPGLSGFVENGWVGRRLHVGPEVTLDVLVPSPRCAVPTLAHGELPPDPDALRVPLRHNFVPIPIEGFGSAPSLGVYAAVVTGGRLSPGDEVRLDG